MIIIKRKEMLEQAYQNYKHGMIHRLNADLFGVSENAVKSWCLRYGWKERLKQEKNMHLFMRRLHEMDA